MALATAEKEQTSWG